MKYDEFFADAFGIGVPLNPVLMVLKISSTPEPDLN